MAQKNKKKHGRTKRRNHFRNHHRRRSRRGRAMQGGLGPNDGINIKLEGRFAFRDPTHVAEFTMFVFGTDRQRLAWTALLQTCMNKNVPVYILTAGNKVGIIRTLQLLNMDHFFREVLCTLKQSPSDPRLTENNMRASPPNAVHHNFGGKHKYEVIREIIGEHGISCALPVKGCLFDDSMSNRDAANICPSIEFLHTKTPARPADYDESTFVNNAFYKLRAMVTGAPPNGVNFTPIALIEDQIRNVVSGSCEIVFIDFDETFEPYPAALPFHNPVRLPQFEENGHPIDIIP
jgi:hypothetical protein